MSALDQAFIKAYAKDEPRPAAAPPVAVTVAAAPARTTRGPGITAIDQIYRDGTLYRIEKPLAAQHAGSAVPRSHFVLPPTSPRRGVRRSILRSLGGQLRSAGSTSKLPEPPTRIARKVMIRHVSHGVSPAPPPSLRAATRIDQRVNHAELPPETIADEPAPTAPVPVNPPVTPLAPQIAPLNEAADFRLHVAVEERWDAATATSAVILVEANSSDAGAGPALVTLQIEGLIAVETDTRQSHAVPERPAEPGESAAFAGKALDHADDAVVIQRLDPPHALSSHRAHVRFPLTLQEAAEPSETVEPIHEELEKSNISGELSDDEHLEALTAFEELSFAEPLDELKTCDSSPADSSISSAEEASAHEHAEASSKAAAWWEVDRFHWPRTCDKLLNDGCGYFAQAGEKLLAAVNDGLRVLAITGSRRGEGRTTLALCLSRAAAQAGIQVAVMDADFARPQLATKIALDITVGWQDAAFGTIPLSEAAVRSLTDNITVLPLESTAARKSLSLADPRVTATIRAAAATFELLILDLGPLSPGHDFGFPLGEACPLDAAIVVRDLRFATSAESEAAGRILQDAGVEAVGIAENFAVDEEE